MSEHRPSDLVALLRDPANNWNSGGRFEAADEIERLQKALERAANFIGRWGAVFNAQERTVLAKEFREAESETWNALRYRSVATIPGNNIKPK